MPTGVRCVANDSSSAIGRQRYARQRHTRPDSFSASPQQFKLHGKRSNGSHSLFAFRRSQRYRCFSQSSAWFSIGHRIRLCATPVVSSDLPRSGSIAPLGAIALIHDRRLRGRSKVLITSPGFFVGSSGVHIAASANPSAWRLRIDRSTQSGSPTKTTLFHCLPSALAAKSSVCSSLLLFSAE